MAKNYYGNRGAARRRVTQRPRKRLEKWPFVVGALLVVTVTFAAAVRCRSVEHEPEASLPGVAATPGVPHYDRLEYARYTTPGHSSAVAKDYEGFTLSFNPSNSTADWVGWELLRSEVNGDRQRSDQFWQDVDVPGCPSTNDYKRSGYDRGHLCPAADQKWSDDAMRDCFVMTNMTPQDHALNAGAWNTLENKERQWAERDSAIVIVAGPIYTDADQKRIGYTGVRVPSAFFKVLLAPYVESPRAIGFIYPNASAPGNMEQYAMNVDEVEEITGLDFFPNLPDEIENYVESRASFKDWNRSR